VIHLHGLAVYCVLRTLYGDCKSYQNILVMCNETYFVCVHLLVLFVKYKSFTEIYAASLNRPFW